MDTAVDNRQNGSNQTDPSVGGVAGEAVSRRIKWAEVTSFPENPPISDNRIARLRKARGYDHNIIGTPELADNSAGAFPDYPPETIFVLDRNNRLQIARLENALDKEFIGKLWRGLSREQMHERALGGNDRRTPKPAERFLRRVAMGDVRLRQINAVIEEMNWRVTYERADGGLSCTHEIEWLWDQGGRTVLTKTIETYEAAFGRSAQSRQANVVKGIGAFWVLYPEADIARVVSCLDELGVKDLFELGRSRRNDLSMAHLHNGMVDVMRHRYNKGLGRESRLPERRL